MSETRRSLLQKAALTLALPTSMAWAQPSPVRIEVGFAAGGTLDVIARRIADRLRGKYAETVIVESRIGAGGRIANEAVKNATPNGSVMVLAPSSSIVIFPHVYKKLAYDPFKDLIAVTPVCSNAQAFVVGPGVPAEIKTLDQFVKWAKVNKAFYGTPAAGSIMHFQGLVFSQKAGIELTHVPYRGMAAIVPDLLSGTLMSSMAVLGDLLPHLESGKLRILAVTSAKRSRFVPTVPTFAELGMSDVTGVDWYGLFLPAGTPPEIFKKLHATTSAAVSDPTFSDSLAQLGFEPYQLPRDEFEARIKAETARWGPIVAASGFNPES